MGISKIVSTHIDIYQYRPAYLNIFFVTAGVSPGRIIQLWRIYKMENALPIILVMSPFLGLSLMILFSGK